MRNKLLYIKSDTLKRLGSIMLGQRFLRKAEIRTIARDNSVIEVIETGKSLNTSDVDYITNDLDGNLYLSSSKMKIKPGKLFKELTDCELDSTAIETLVSIWKSQYCVDTSVVETSSDISSVYDIGSCGGSCMAHKGSFMGIYYDAGATIAYIGDEYEGLCARCLLWDNLVDSEGNSYKVRDRIFYESEHDKITLQKWCKENGYKSFKELDGLHLFSKTIADEYPDGVPYIDTMCYVTKYKGNFVLSNDYDEYLDKCQTTEGASNDGFITEFSQGIYCEDTDTYEYEDDVYFVEDLDCYYYYNDSLVYVDGYGWYTQTCDDICYCEDTDEYDFIENCFQCYISGNWYSSTNEMVYVEDIEDYVHEDEIDELWYDEYEECYKYYREEN